MVFTVIDRLFGGIPNKNQWETPWSLIGHLRNEGFSLNEAKNVGWMLNHRMKGEIIGLSTGLLLIYTFDGGIQRFCVRNPWLGIRVLGLNGVRLGIVLGSYMVGGFTFVFPHKGSNSHVSDLTNNDLYMLTRHHFINNFEVLNRNFTDEEVEQFLNNEDLKRLGKRKYIFNPLVYDNEQEYKKVYERLNSGQHKLSDEELKRIEETNKAKSDLGEKV